MNRKTKALEFVDAGYNVSVTGRNFQVTEAMKDYAIEKISKLDRFHSRIIDVNVIMDVQKLDHKVDIVMKVDQIKIKSHASSSDMYASIDMAVNKLDNQLRRYKEKINDHHAKGVKVVYMNVNVIRAPELDELFEVNDEIESETTNRKIDGYRPHEIVGKKTLPQKVLTLDEAIMKMELSGDPFLIFRSEQNMKLNVIYRRKDGNYGIIEPEAS
jgi:putative sigma-54 modulation protein